MGPNEAAAWLAAARELLEKAVEQGIRIDGNVFAAGMGLAVLIGLANCLVGYRVFKILLAIWGLVVGAVGGAAVGWHYGAQTGALIGAMVGGLAAAAGVAVFYLAGVFALAALIGAGAAAIFCDANALPLLPGVIGTAIVFGILGLVVQKLVVIVVTSFSGAASAVLGGYYFLGNLARGDFELFTDADHNKALVAMFLSNTRRAESELVKYAMKNPVVQAFADQRGRLLLWVLALGVLGVAVQYGLTAKRRKILEAAGDPVG